MKTKLLFISYLAIPLLTMGQPDWSGIKDTIAPQVMLPEEYGTPYRLAGTLGWEDGQTITRDGLTIYCYYSPLDLLSFSYPPCGKVCIDPCNISPYRRGPFPEILDSVPPVLHGICNEFLSSDILWSHRNTLQEPFPSLSPINLRIPAAFEGAPQLILNSTSPSMVDYFVFTLLQPDSTLSSDNTSNIYWIKNTGLNPSGTYTPLPPPINTDSTSEDNPHLERLSANEFVLFFTSDDRQPSVGEVDIYVSTSTDTGNTWTTPQLVNFNTPLSEDMPHLWKDSSGIWWLYYMDQNSEIVRRKQQTPGDWVNWDSATPVIAKGNAFAIGEPTLTQWGDIVFGLVYDAGTGWGTDTTNRYDDDFWILPRLGSPLSLHTPLIKKKNLEVKTYPNPTSNTITIKILNGEEEYYSLILYNAMSQIVKMIHQVNSQISLDLKNFSQGIYFFRLTNEKSQTVYTGKIIKE